MKNILFISGFNTHPEEQKNFNIYSSLEVYFTFSNYTITFFTYKTTENLDDVYKRLFDILITKKHDIIMTHSLGSCLYLKYVSQTNDTRKAILCMPFIHSTTFLKCLSYLHIYIVENVYIPKCCVIPNSSLFHGGNILNDDTNLISFHQIHNAINNYFLPENQLVQLINSHQNIRIIYCMEEDVSPIHPSILSQIQTKVTMTKGKHVSFSNIYFMKDFFDAVTDELKKIE